MIVQFLVKINDIPDLTLTGMKKIIKEQWLPQADAILTDNPYSHYHFVEAQENVDRFAHYGYCKRILTRPSLRQKFSALRIAKLIEFVQIYEQDPVDFPVYEKAKKILEVKRNVDWANDVVMDWKNKKDSELKDHIDKKNAGKWKDGDIVEAFSPSRCKKAWDEMLANGRVNQSEYDSAKLQDGTFRWAWGAEEVKVHQAFVIEDDFTDEEINSFVHEKQVAEGLDENGEPVYKMERRRNFKIDIEDVTYFSNGEGKRKKFSNDTKDKIRNPNILVAPRYDKPVLKNEIKAK